MLKDQRGFPLRHASGVCFERPFAQLREIESFAKALQKKIQLGRGERSRCSTAKKDRLRFRVETVEMLIQFAQNRIAESLHLRGIGALFIKCAIRANPCAEGN